MNFSDSIYDYLDSLVEMRKMIIVVSIKDQVGSWFNFKIQEKLKEIGCEISLVGLDYIGYIYIYFNNSKFYEDISKYGFVEYNGYIEDNEIYIYSAPYKNGNESVIMINGIDYSINKRGFNFVIYDPVNKKKIDSVNFDTHLEKVAPSRCKAPLIRNDIEVHKITDIYQYLQKISSFKHLIVISVKDNAGYWFNFKIKKLFNDLGLQINLFKKFMVSYIAIIYNRNVLHEVFDYQTLVKKISINKIPVQVISSPFNRDNISSVCINNIEYSKDSRGLNIVIYDLDILKLIDSVSFDTHVYNFACTRMHSRYDIAIVSYWFGTNYGSILNGFAIYNFLKKQYKVLLINKPNASRNDWEICNNHNSDFFNNYIDSKDISPSLEYNDLEKLNKFSNIFLTGSDQLWSYNVNKDFNMFFMQNFVNLKNKKLSFCTSFGASEDYTPLDVLKYNIKLLKNFDAISVREDSGVKICKETYGLSAVRLIEPVFLLSIEELDILSKKSKRVLPEKYIISYILDPDSYKVTVLNKFIKFFKVDCFNIIDGNPLKYDDNKNFFNKLNVEVDIPVEEFLNFFKNAEFIITDSFHGLCFSIIFRKKFCVIGNELRGLVRFEEILSRLSLNERMIKENDSFDIKTFLMEIDYTFIHKVIRDEVKKAKSWLLYNIKECKKNLKPILNYNNILEKIDLKLCTGCSACINICNNNALYQSTDEYGFFKPKINLDRCINCGKCIRVCPVIYLPANSNELNPDCYAFIASNRDLLLKSSSGGIFSILSNIILDKKGYICGAAWNDKLLAEHVIIKNKKDLSKLQKSKYLQSEIGFIFKDVQNTLQNNKIVLFSGTPCQVAGLKNFLNKDYNNLFLIDIFCSYVPSQLFFKKYINEYYQNNIKKFDFRFKNKEGNFRCDKIRFVDLKNTQIIKNIDDDVYQQLYHDHVMIPRHCEKCIYQQCPRIGDISIGYFWGIQDKINEIDFNNGCSLILCNNGKGRSLLKKIRSQDSYFFKKVPLNWIGDNGFAVNNSENWASSKRDCFYSMILNNNFSEIVPILNKYNCD